MDIFFEDSLRDIISFVPHSMQHRVLPSVESPGLSHSYPSSSTISGELAVCSRVGLRTQSTSRPLAIK